MKLIVEPSHRDYATYIEKGANGFLLGLEDFCCDFSITHSLEEIKKIREQYPSVELFISINKMIYDQERKALEDVLEELDKIEITGVCFYDLALLQLKRELGLNLPLVWNQNLMVTNVKTCRYYQEKGVEYAYLASEITLEEMIEIKQKTKMKCMALLFGYPVVAHSKRTLLTNYYDFLKKEKKTVLEIKEPISKQTYLVREDKTGTTFLFHQLLNGSKAYLSLLDVNFDYGILKEDEVDHTLFLQVLEEFALVSKKEKPDQLAWLSNMNELIGTKTGFFYQKTIFKVKKNEKN